jgi:hypothetical protein
MNKSPSIFLLYKLISKIWYYYKFTDCRRILETLIIIYNGTVGSKAVAVCSHSQDISGKIFNERINPKLLERNLDPLVLTSLLLLLATTL